MPLTLPELAEAVILEPEFDQIDPDARLNNLNDVLEICGSLVAFSSTSQTTRIAHHSVREFLTERLNEASEYYIPANSSHRALAEACISYVLLEDFADSQAAAKELSACQAELDIHGDDRERAEWLKLLDACHC